jgi:hypothetical protein
MISMTAAANALDSAAGIMGTAGAIGQQYPAAARSQAGSPVRMSPKSMTPQ